jgi:hypothetical protein
MKIIEIAKTCQFTNAIVEFDPLKNRDHRSTCLSMLFESRDSEFTVKCKDFFTTSFTDTTLKDFLELWKTIVRSRNVTQHSFPSKEQLDNIIMDSRFSSQGPHLCALFDFQATIIDANAGM